MKPFIKPNSGFGTPSGAQKPTVSANELAIFAMAAAMSNPGDRETYLTKACGGDVDLRHRVEERLAARMIRSLEAGEAFPSGLQQPHPEPATPASTTQQPVPVAPIPEEVPAPVVSESPSVPVSIPSVQVQEVPAAAAPLSFTEDFEPEPHHFPTPIDEPVPQPVAPEPEPIQEIEEPAAEIPTELEPSAPPELEPIYQSQPEGIQPPAPGPIRPQESVRVPQPQSHPSQSVIIPQAHADQLNSPSAMALVPMSSQQLAALTAGRSNTFPWVVAVTFAIITGGLAVLLFQEREDKTRPEVVGQESATSIEARKQAEAVAASAKEEAEAARLEADKLKSELAKQRAEAAEAKKQAAESQEKLAKLEQEQASIPKAVPLVPLTPNSVPKPELPTQPEPVVSTPSPVVAPPPVPVAPPVTVPPITKTEPVPVAKVEPAPAPRKPEVAPATPVNSEAFPAVTDPLNPEPLVTTPPSTPKVMTTESSPPPTSAVANPAADEFSREAVRLMGQSRFTEAEAAARQGFDLRAAQNETSWAMVEVQAILGAAHLQRDADLEAEQNLTAAANMILTLGAPQSEEDRVRFTQAIKRVNLFFNATGRRKEGAEWKRKFDALKPAQ